MALPIGEGQTISPPFVVAYMTEALDPQPGDVVLEIGTGSGYQAAVLSKLVKEVYTIEIVEKLGHRAEQTLKRLHYDNVHVKVGDGYLGWPEHAPFDKIIVTCSPEKAPPALVEQLKEGGRMVIPVGERYQQTLYLQKKTGGKMVSEALQATLFVPMTGAAEAERAVLPDPANPKITNGGFEKVQGDPPSLVGWHYQRQLRWSRPRTPPRGATTSRSATRRPAAAATPSRASPSMGGRCRPWSSPSGSAASTSAPDRRPSTASSGPAWSSASMTRTGRPSAKSPWGRTRGGAASIGKPTPGGSPSPSGPARPSSASDSSAPQAKSRSTTCNLNRCGNSREKGDISGPEVRNHPLQVMAVPGILIAMALTTEDRRPSQDTARLTPRERLERFAVLQRRAAQLLAASREGYRQYWVRNLRQRSIHVKF